MYNVWLVGFRANGNEVYSAQVWSAAALVWPVMPFDIARMIHAVEQKFGVTGVCMLAATPMSHTLAGEPIVYI